MTADMDKFISDTQAEIDSQAEKRFGQEVVTRWKQPTHYGILLEPSAVGIGRHQGGLEITVYLQIEDGRITTARFTGNGCGPSMVCANVACELAEGEIPDQAAALTAEHIREVLPNMPGNKQHYLDTAAAALHAAVEDWQAAPSA